MLVAVAEVEQSHASTIANTPIQETTRTGPKFRVSPAALASRIPVFAHREFAKELQCSTDMVGDTAKKLKLPRPKRGQSNFIYSHDAAIKIANAQHAHSGKHREAAAAFLKRIGSKSEANRIQE